MVVRTVQLSEFANVLKKFSKTTIDEQRYAVTKGIIDSLPEVIKSSPVDTAQYANSWDFSVEENQVIFGNFAPHAPIIEAGARPFTPPIGPLLAWAKRVLNDPSQPPKYSSEVWALAKGTQNKIARVGMDPKHIMELHIPKIIENMRKELQRL